MIDQAQTVLGYRFAKPELLQIALTHASTADQRVLSNERLEFLGDAVLGLVVCEELYRARPALLEGEMTKIKSAVVSRKTCAQVANAKGLTELLHLGKGMRSRERVPSSVAAAVLEAVTGAIYLDGGLEAARQFILRCVADELKIAGDSAHQENYKSVLQQFTQRHLPWVPRYTIVSEGGPDHRKTFAVRVELAQKRFSPAEAASKKSAEQKAARKALEEMGVLIVDGDGAMRLLTEDEAAPLVPEMRYDG